jgi:hypothetical protein
MGVGGQCHAPAALPPGKRPGTHCTGGCVGPRASLDRCRKILPPLGFDLWPVQPVVITVLNYTILAHLPGQVLSFTLR